MNKENMFTQDWAPLVIKRPKPPPKAPNVNFEQMKKMKNLEGDLQKDQEPPAIKLNILNSEMRKTMIEARTLKKLSQVKLANMINEKFSTINSLENGKFDQSGSVMVLQKLSKVLGVHLKF